MDYGALIGDSLRLTLRNRYLWFFGFFAGGTGTNLVFQVPSNLSDLQNMPDGLDSLDPTPALVSPALLLQTGPGGVNVALVAALALLVILLVLAFIALSLISHAGLVRGAAAIERDEVSGGSRFAATWRSGVNGMWRVLGLVVLLFLLGLGILLAAGVPAGVCIGLVFLLTQSVAARVVVTVLVSLVVMILLVAIFIPLVIIGQLALRRTLLAGDGITGCIGGGYGVFRRNLGRSLLVWLIQIVVAFGLGIALLIAAIIVGVVLFLPTMILAFAGLTTAAVVTGAVAGFLLLALFIVASGALGTFGSAYWTLAYLRLEAAEAHSGSA
ncbi:hypothetical protein [Rubrobacter aplysinae]|uniref:hypothetical protein n=1 Tax=Rubrobacter aplysinae TaxID=909625 RepID=UPI00064BCCDB|nr:hypothetical protein [Rubrobacter aplysinae]